MSSMFRYETGHKPKKNALISACAATKATMGLFRHREPFVSFPAWDYVRVSRGSLFRPLAGIGSAIFG